MSTALQLPAAVTVAEFVRVTGEEYAELLDGVIVERPVPNVEHMLLEHRLLFLLRSLLGADWVVAVELTFRPTPEFSLPRADVAVVSRARIKAADPKEDLPGVPELIIEVNSPSNNERNMEFKRRLCLRHGAVEFWSVYPDMQTVLVAKPDGSRQLYESGQSVGLGAFGGAELQVDAIFADLESAV